ncbi:MAG TPA: hypothetical protein VLD57_08535 [Blastocatellia bacterium]|nr:hypothetical protein [Blastocatellia bacterium]
MPSGKNIKPEESRSGTGGTTGGVAGAGGSADETETVGTSGRNRPAAGGPVGGGQAAPGGNLTGSKSGTTASEGNADHSSTGLGVAKDD